MERRQQLLSWLAAEFPGRAFELAPASADASFRRYFRVSFADDPAEETPGRPKLSCAPLGGLTQSGGSGGSQSLIVMDAPPEHEDCRPFLHVAALFGKAGVHVPQVYKHDLAQGFMLLSDLGSTTYLQALDADNAASLYADALGALIAIQLASQPAVLPEYSRELLLRELELFPVWYVTRHKGFALSEKHTEQLYEVFDRILDVNLAEPQVFVHRDFHSRNLMVSTPNPGIVDFQDAVYGPLSYDLASLLKDAYIHWEEDFVLDMLARYWETARHLGLPVRADFADFHRDFEWMGVQRHIKILGIFARLAHRDGKEAYLQDMPLVLQYLRKTCERYRDLRPLLRLLEELEPTVTEVGYSF